MSFRLGLKIDFEKEIENDNALKCFTALHCTAGRSLGCLYQHPSARLSVKLFVFLPLFLLQVCLIQADSVEFGVQVSGTKKVVRGDASTWSLSSPVAPLQLLRGPTLDLFNPQTHQEPCMVLGNQGWYNSPQGHLSKMY